MNISKTNQLELNQPFLHSDDLNNGSDSAWVVGYLMP